jgi:hypothetical protein
MSPPMVHLQSQINPIHITPSDHSKIQSILVLSSHLLLGILRLIGSPHTIPNIRRITDNSGHNHIQDTNYEAQSIGSYCSNIDIIQ